MRVHSPLVGVYGPSLFYMHLGSFKMSVGSVVPRVGDPLVSVQAHFTTLFK